MAQYDPRRSRPRPTTSDDEPAPVDALLEAHPTAPTKTVAPADAASGREPSPEPETAEAPLAEPGAPELSTPAVDNESSGEGARTTADAIPSSLSGVGRSGVVAVGSDDRTRTAALAAAIVAMIIVMVVWSWRRSRPRD